jgi:transposase
MTHSALAIDISKLKFDVALLRAGGKFKHRVFPNTPAGFLQLSAWLMKQKVERVHACLEATGTYSEATGDLPFGRRPHRECRQPGGHQGLRSESPLAHQD